MRSQLELAIAKLLDGDGVQTVRINLRPVQVRHGHHDVVPRLDDLDPLCSCSQLEDAS